MEGALALLDGFLEPLAHHVQVGVVGELEVVDAGHDGGKEVVGRER